MLNVCVICARLRVSRLPLFCPIACMRRIGEPITPKFRPGKPIPRWFKWRKETYELCRLIESWTKESTWWRHTGPKRRVYYRVEVRGPHPTDVWSRFTCIIMHQTYGESETWQMASVDD